MYQQKPAIDCPVLIKSETRNLKTVSCLQRNYTADVTIKQGSANSIVITADDNLLKQISSSVEDGVLRISSNEGNWNDRIKPTEGVQIVITLKDVSKITLSSAGTLQVLDLTTESLQLTVSGAGDISLANLDVASLEVTLSGAGSISADGTAESLDVRISGFGDFKGADLRSQDANVRVTGAGSSTVWAEETLTASISGAGDIRYYGNPAVDESISGAGNVNRLGDK